MGDQSSRILQRDRFSSLLLSYVDIANDVSYSAYVVKLVRLLSEVRLRRAWEVGINAMSPRRFQRAVSAAFMPTLPLLTWFNNLISSGNKGR